MREPHPLILAIARRILVCGGRDFNDRDLMARTLKPWRPDPVTEFCETILITGGTKEDGGADGLADEWADVWGVRKRIFKAKWDDIHRPGALVRRRRDGTFYDALAGPIRNQRMLDEGKPDLVIAFKGGDGTRDMVKRAKKAGVPVKVIKERFERDLFEEY